MKETIKVKFLKYYGYFVCGVVFLVSLKYRDAIFTKDDEGWYLWTAISVTLICIYILSWIINKIAPVIFNKYFYQLILSIHLISIILLSYWHEVGYNSFYGGRNGLKEDPIQVTLKEDSDLIVKNLKDKIYINIYMSGNLSPQFQKIQSSITSTLEEFQNISNKEIDFEYITINDNDNTENQKGIYNPLINLGLHPIWITTDADKVHKTYPYAIVHFREKALPVLLYNSLYYDTISDPSNEDLERCINNLEYNFMESFYLIQQEEKKKIAFLQGHGELDSLKTWDIRNTISKYYKIDNFDLTLFPNVNNDSEKINQQIQKLNSYNTIIIAKPKKAFNDLDKYIIDQYIMNGGRTLWLIEGTNTSLMHNYTGHEFTIKRDSFSSQIESLLSNYGAKVNHDLIQDEVCTQNIILENDTLRPKKWQYNPLLVSEKNHLISSYGDSILTHFVSSIKILKPEISTILISSSEKSNILNEGEKVTRKIIKNPKNTLIKKKTIAVIMEDEFNSAFSTYTPPKGVNIKRKSKNNKILIISDGDIIANKHINHFKRPLGWDPLRTSSSRTNIYDGNTTFILTALQYLCDDEVLIKIRSKIK